MAFAALEMAVKTLITVYKNHKDAKRELQEVGHFLVDLRENSPILKAKNGGLNDVKNTLRRKLESAKKQVEELSSRNLDFFHSDERLRKIHGVRQKVKDAMEEARDQLHVNMYELMDELRIGIAPQPTKVHHRLGRRLAHSTPLMPVVLPVVQRKEMV